MKKFNLSHLLAIALVALSLSTFACKQPTSDSTSTITYIPTTASEAELAGTWLSTYDETFTITDSSLTNSYSGSEIYAGDTLCVMKISDTEGTIFIKYTSNAYNSSVVGKWYAVNYKNLTSSSISLSGAYKDDGVSGTDTLAEAFETFTIDNGYFGIYSECVKQ